MKTTYLLGFIDDPALRRMVGLQLSRGEFRQKLACHTFFANQGEFRTDDYFETMNKASCLSLLSTPSSSITRCTSATFSTRHKRPAGVPA